MERFAGGFFCKQSLCVPRKNLCASAVKISDASGAGLRHQAARQRAPVAVAGGAAGAAEAGRRHLAAGQAGEGAFAPARELASFRISL